MTRGLVLTGILVCVSGCGSRRPEAEIERGRQAVVAALDGWKGNEPAAKLKSLPDPVEFSDELRGNFALTDYTLGKVDGTVRTIRYTVTLKLKDKKGKTSDREVVYAVALKGPVVVARDPYY